MMRLFMLEKLREARSMLDETVRVLRRVGARHVQQRMPGYTHMQRAMPTTVGTWLHSYADALAECVPVLDATVVQLDCNPLGSAAGFGIAALPPRRELTTAALGFARVQENPMYCALSRGTFELAFLQALLLPLVLAGRFAADMLMFTQQETAFFSLPDAFVTGSSIMPHKKNYDLFEVMRATTRAFAARHAQVLHTVAALGAGYHRDLQLSKQCVL